MKINELSRITEKHRNGLPYDSLRNCEEINKSLSRFLGTNRIPSEYRIGYITDSNQTTPQHSHVWLEIKQEYVSDADSPVVVDGALDQFCTANYEFGEVPLSIGQKDEIPSVVVFEKDGNSKYKKWYTFQIAEKGIRLL